MSFHFFSSPNPIALTPYPRLRKCCLPKTQVDCIACGETIVSQMNQVRPLPELCDDGTPAKSPCLRSSIKKEIGGNL